MKVLIAGGGCAGPALAFWLIRMGHQVIIVERASNLRANGAQIDFRAQGIETLQRMGIMEDIRSLLVDEAGVAMIDPSGRRWATILANTSGQGLQGPTSEFEIMRGDLVRLLYEKTKEKVEYRFGVTVVGFEQDDERVVVELSDGTTEVVNLMVGADGQGSRIRKAILPETSDAVYRTGFHMAYFFVPRIASDTNIRDVYAAPGGRQINRRSHNSTETQALFSLRDDDHQYGEIHRASEAEQKAFWKAKFRGAGWQTDRFLSYIDDTPSWYSAEVIQVRSSRWHKGRVVLLGDAAYCPSPLSGMGTTSSFVGAYVLAGELSRTPDDVRAALANYDKTLRPFAEKTQNVNFGLRRMLMPMTWWGVWVFRVVMSVLCALKVPQLIMRFRGQGKDEWQLPEYPNLKSS